MKEELRYLAICGLFFVVMYLIGTGFIEIMKAVTRGLNS